MYQKREKFLTIDPETNISIDDNENNIPEASPGKEKEKEKEKEIENDNKFSRRPYVKPRDTRPKAFYTKKSRRPYVKPRDTRPKAFYTKKIILEEVIPRKKEVIPEKKKYRKNMKRKKRSQIYPLNLKKIKYLRKKKQRYPK